MHLIYVTSALDNVHLIGVYVCRTSTYPSTLFRDPLGYLLDDDEPTDEADDLGEEAADASLQDGDGHSVAEAQQRDDPAPADVVPSK